MFKKLYRGAYKYSFIHCSCGSGYWHGVLINNRELLGRQFVNKDLFPGLVLSIPQLLELVYLFRRAILVD